jgi:hypothetical protein
VNCKREDSSTVFAIASGRSRKGGSSPRRTSNTARSFSAAAALPRRLQLSRGRTSTRPESPSAPAAHGRRHWWRAVEYSGAARVPRVLRPRLLRAIQMTLQLGVNLLPPEDEKCFLERRAALSPARHTTPSAYSAISSGVAAPFPFSARRCIRVRSRHRFWYRAAIQPEEDKSCHRYTSPPCRCARESQPF